MAEQPVQSDIEFRQHVQDHIDRLQESAEGLSVRVQSVERDLLHNTRLTAELSGKIEAMHAENVSRFQKISDDIAPVLALVKAGHVVADGARTTGRLLDRTSRVTAKLGRWLLMIGGAWYFAKTFVASGSFSAAVNEFSRFVK